MDHIKHKNQDSDLIKIDFNNLNEVVEITR